MAELADRLGRARERDPRLPGRARRRGDAAARGAGRARRDRRATRPRPARRRPSSRPRRASTTSAWRSSRPGRRSRRSSRASRIRFAVAPSESRSTCTSLAGVLEEASAAIDAAYGDLRRALARRILGEERENEPASAHVAYVRRLSPLAGTYTKERAVPVCLATLTELGFDLAADERHPARPRRSPAEEPAGVRHRLRPPERRPPDHSRPGRPRRLPGVPARGRPRPALRRAATRSFRTRSGGSRATTR